MKKSWVIMSLFIVFLTGCLGGGPTYKKAPRQPLPKESYESRERTMQAIQAVLAYCKQIDAAKEIQGLLKALLVKIGIPVKEVKDDPKAKEELSKAIKKDAEQIRKERLNWDKTYDKKEEYIKEGTNTGVISKAKRSLFWIVVILVIWGFIAPASLAAVLKMLHHKAKQSLSTLEAELKEKRQYEEFAQNNIKGIEAFKKDNPDMWLELKEYLRISHTADSKEVVEKVKKQHA